eukprot:CAMPEP_0169227348 /NCGR_PEP_ID=MMETSP1016-20121227/24252_1 /TAXON_ID=342587 /ORGANISM="Karlodinium micrum, Strain CCMP2283" /LENGTH=80 /DNA_ID=CAMNT_0009306053 /DNA_START=152 /DNA_END=394 /DNA_ORIENTATION=+
MATRHISAFDEGVAFGELVSGLHARYGLATNRIQERLFETVMILGYDLDAVADDTVIEHGDANILLEEIEQMVIHKDQVE